MPQHPLTTRDVRTPPGTRAEAPVTMEQLGLPARLLTDLCLRIIREQGTSTIGSFRKRLKVSYPIGEAIFQYLKQEKLVDIKGTLQADYVFSLTAGGKAQAAETLQVCRYAGPAPVPLDQYRKVVTAQSAALRVTRDELRSAMDGLVIEDEILDQLGPALVSGKPVFIYGPSGNGKTSIVQRLPRLFRDSILVPYCVEVDGHIISVFDPSVHPPLDDAADPVDPRWVRCQRPCVVAGGELMPESLTVRLDHTTGVYAAPLQMKAANGIFLIDDFGRQAISPRQLFNRWIMPLDRKIDHLVLEHGYLFKIPFELTLVFSTNMNPEDLTDEAFIRRVPNKIYLGPISDSVFDRIFELVMLRMALPYEPEMAASLRRLCKENGARNLRACYPGDICEIIGSLASYSRKPLAINAQNLYRATRLYFMQHPSG